MWHRTPSGDNSNYECSDDNSKGQSKAIGKDDAHNEGYEHK
jgi:hypothetical protein